MRRINSLTLQNCQIFRDRIFKFCPTTNVIIGDNNTGKSTIIRSLYWVLNNGPAGDWMRTFDPKGTTGERLTSSACIEWDDGIRIKRVKGDDINAYYLDDEEFTKVGRGGPPEPIADIIGITMLPFGNSLMPIIAMQDELPFMVFESAPNKGSLINYLTGADVGDRMRKDINKEARSRNAELNRNLAEIERLDAELDKYKTLDKLKKKLNKAQNLKNKATTYYSRRRQLADIAFHLTAFEIKKLSKEKKIERYTIAITVATECVNIQNAIDGLKTYNRMQVTAQCVKASEALLNRAESQAAIYTQHSHKKAAMEELNKQYIKVTKSLDLRRSDIKKLEKELSNYEECCHCSGTGVICHAEV